MSDTLWTRNPNETFTRRALLGQGAAGVFALGMVSRNSSASDEDPNISPSLIVRSRRPLDLETPVSGLDTFLTSNDAFFVRSHFGAPVEGFKLWPIEVNGLAGPKLQLKESDLASLPQFKITAVLQCSGNGRSFFRPNIPGLAWERGAVGNAEWEGVRLADVLALLGIEERVSHVHFLGADGPPGPKTPLFLRSLPIEKALHPDTILATKMNGEPLPLLHGGPVRLVVPGWTGNHWMKWLRHIRLAREEAPGFYMQTGYRFPKVPSPPEVVVKPADLIALTTLNVKSLITWPLEGAQLRAGRHELRGVAWTGEGKVTRVRVASQIQGNADLFWKEATLDVEERPWSWRRWRMRFDVDQKGGVNFLSRATDSNGTTQPVSTPWNKSGYQWNAVDRVTCEIV